MKIAYNGYTLNGLIHISERIVGGHDLTAQLDGRIVREQSGFFYVEVDTDDSTIYRCQLRGRLKEEAQASDIAAIGDRVTMTPLDNEGIDIETGIIEDVHERHSTLSRAVRTSGKRGGGQAQREHVLVANLDQAFFVFAVQQPSPNWKMLDRLLVTGESSYIDHLTIVINKIDLAAPDILDNQLKPYREMGYEVIFTSALEAEGVDKIKARLPGRISAFTGPSGVGKSSLLNCLQPGLSREVKSISEYSQEGLHTTRDSALVRLQSGGYLADTPGIRQMHIWDVEPDELDAYFLDIAEKVPFCRFNDCTHTAEPGCAVVQAVQNDDIAERRYEHYLELRDELRDTYIVY
jgi:ribosome biogenesis GTPase